MAKSRFKRVMRLYVINLVLAMIAAALVVFFVPKSDALQEIPLRDFFKNPEQSEFQISQHAVYISYLKPWNNRMNVFMQKLSKDRLPIGSPKQLTFVKDRDISYYSWKGDSTVLYLKDTGGDENFHVYAVDVESGKDRDLTPFTDTRAWIHEDLNDISETDVLISSNQRNSEIFDIYRTNVNTGVSSIVAKNPGNFDGWLSDHNGVVRIATECDGLLVRIHSRDSGDAEFKKILEFNYTNELDPLAFTSDNKFFYASSNLNRDKKSIVIIDPKDGREVSLLLENADVDINNINYSAYLKKITSASFVTWRNNYYFFDDAAKSRYDKIQNHVGGRQLYFSSSNHTEDLFTIVVKDDKTSATSYLYDEKNDRLTLLYDTSSYLPREKLADMRPVEYISRDGLKIHGYLTLPVNSSGQNLPLIVHPHGGPWGIRDQWLYKPQVQFLANRGYAVLQINYRGSGGYGKEFYKKSFRQWGLNMQNDITDGVNWLVDKGVADPKRIGIYGASYGGYATLAGVTFTPDLYACAVDYVGVSNLITFIDTIPPYWKPFKAQLFDKVGDPSKDREFLMAASPVFHADKIKAPLFVAQGAKDPRVNINESDQIVAALRMRGVEVEYMVKENEGHGFHNEENRFEFYEAMEKFLYKYLKSKTPAQ